MKAETAVGEHMAGFRDNGLYGTCNINSRTCPTQCLWPTSSDIHVCVQRYYCAGSVE